MMPSPRTSQKRKPGLHSACCAHPGVIWDISPPLWHLSSLVNHFYRSH
jgi:hypothetical protein